MNKRPKSWAPSPSVQSRRRSSSGRAHDGAGAGGGEEMDVVVEGDCGNVVSLLQRCSASAVAAAAGPAPASPSLLPLLLLRGRILHHALLCAAAEEAQGVFLHNHVVHMYGSCGAPHDAWAVFAATPHRNVFSWNIMLGSIASSSCWCSSQQQQHGSGAWSLFAQMLMEGIAPDSVTFVNMISSSRRRDGEQQQQQQLVLVRRVHAMLVGCGQELHVVVGTALMSVYSERGDMRTARSIFRRMPTHNAVTWSAMTSASAQHGHGHGHGHGHDAMQQHVDDVPAGLITLVAALSAAAGLAWQHRSLGLHARAVLHGFDTHPVVATALVHAYAKCGDLSHCDAAFARMLPANALSFTALMAAHAAHGCLDRVLALFLHMLSLRILPDRVSFLCLISACARLGTPPHQALAVFASMLHLVPPSVEHFNALLDLLGRSGRLDDAQLLLRTMPCSPTTASLFTLLAACKLHSDAERARTIARRSIIPLPDAHHNPAPFLLLSGTLAAAAATSTVIDTHVLLEELED